MAHNKVYGFDENMNKEDVNNKAVFTKQAFLNSSFKTNSQVPVAIPNISFELTTHRKSCNG